MALEDSDNHSGSIGNTNSFTLTVNTDEADYVVLTIDDGTTDNTPPQYDMIQRVESRGFGRFQFYDEVTGQTSRSWIDAAAGSQFQAEITNQSGGSANFDASLEARSSSGGN